MWYITDLAGASLNRKTVYRTKRNLLIDRHAELLQVEVVASHFGNARNSMI